MENLNDIIEKIKIMLKKYYDNDIIDNNTLIISKECKLLDSLNINNFICELEHTFKIEDLMYRDVTMSNFKSVYTLASYIFELKGNDENE